MFKGSVTNENKNHLSPTPFISLKVHVDYPRLKRLCSARWKLRLHRCGHSCFSPKCRPPTRCSAVRLFSSPCLARSGMGAIKKLRAYNYRISSSRIRRFATGSPCPPAPGAEYSTGWNEEIDTCFVKSLNGGDSGTISYTREQSDSN